MNRFEKRKVKIHIVPRDARDSWKLLRTIEITVRGGQIEIEVQEQNTSENSKADSHAQNFLDIQFEEEVFDEVRNRLDELEEDAERSKIPNKSQEKKDVEKDVSAKRRKIRTWLKEIAKEGYRITVKSFFDSILDKSKPM